MPININVADENSYDMASSTAKRRRIKSLSEMLDFTQMLGSGEPANNQSAWPTNQLRAITPTFKDFVYQGKTSELILYQEPPLRLETALSEENSPGYKEKSRVERVIQENFNWTKQSSPAVGNSSILNRRSSKQVVNLFQLFDSGVETPIQRQISMIHFTEKSVGIKTERRRDSNKIQRFVQLNEEVNVVRSHISERDGEDSSESQKRLEENSGSLTHSSSDRPATKVVNYKCQAKV